MNYKKILLTFILTITFVFSCDILNDPYRVYVISPNEHLSKPYVKPSKINYELSCRVWINDACNSYTPTNPEQVNKLTGISTRPVIKNDNSAMLGWKTLKDGTLIFMFYVNYSSTIFVSKPIKIGKTNTWYDLNIWAEAGEYFIIFDDVLLKLPKYDSDYKFWMVDPYFGGKAPNPSTENCIVKIELF